MLTSPPNRSTSTLSALARIVACGAGLLLASCGGGSSPSAPSTPTPPPAPNPPAATGWNVRGQVVATGSGQPVPGASVTFEAGAAQTTADGTFTFTNANPGLGTTPFKATVQAAGYITREVYLSSQPRTREGIVISLIRDSAPFSLKFYQQIVRNMHEEPERPQPLRRWTSNPKIYIQTADQNGRPIEPEVLAVVANTLPRAVSLFSDGKVSIESIERGPEARPRTPGWINVLFRRESDSKYCGTAYVGAYDGQITLWNDLCSCGSVKVSPQVVIHEVGHAMGFWHVDNPRHAMWDTAAGSCPSGELSLEEKTHVAVAYQRPVGSLDVDRDPVSAPMLRAAGGDAPQVLCGLGGTH